MFIGLGYHCVGHAGLELIRSPGFLAILLPQPSEYWDCKCAPPHLGEHEHSAVFHLLSRPQNHHLYIIKRYCHHFKIKPMLYPFCSIHTLLFSLWLFFFLFLSLSLTLLPRATNLISISMDLPILNISYKWNSMTRDLLSGFFHLVFSRFIHSMAYIS